MFNRRADCATTILFQDHGCHRDTTLDVREDVMELLSASKCVPSDEFILENGQFVTSFGGSSQTDRIRTQFRISIVQVGGELS